MPVVSVPYRFSARLPARPEIAYRWATDFRPSDLALGGRLGVRKVEWLTEDALLLTDSIPKGDRTETKTRMVRLYPKRRSWTNTHVSGPNLHSQFLYEIVPSGRGSSRLEFTGLQLVRMRHRPSRGAIVSLGRAYAREDAGLWRRLARAMGRDLGARAVRSAARRVPGRLRRRRRGSR